MQGGASGASVEPGDSENSYLYMLMAHDSEPFMPPNSDKMPAEMLAVIKAWIEGGALETKSSKAVVKPKEQMELALTFASNERPEGPPPMPTRLSLQPVVHTERTTAVNSIATSPWAPLVAISGQKQIQLYNTQTLQLAGVIPFPEGEPQVLRFTRNGQFLLAAGGVGSSIGRVVLFDVKTGERITEVGDELDAVLGADISSDLKYIALGGPQKVVRIYSTQTGEKLGSKSNAQHVRINKVRLRTSPLLFALAADPSAPTIERGASAGDHRVHMRVSVQFLIPRVQHHRGRRFEPLFVLDSLLQRTPRTLKQQVEHRSTISQSQRRKLLRNREHDLKIIDVWQQQFRRRIQPTPSPGSAATRAMPIAARIIDDGSMITRIALVQMPAQRSCPAQRKFRQSTLHVRWSLSPMFANETRSILSQKIGYAESLFGAAQPGSCRTGSQSAGDGTLFRCSCRTCRYFIVVLKLLCPSSREIANRSTPASSRCVANECRSV